MTRNMVAPVRFVVLTLIAVLLGWGGSSLAGEFGPAPHRLVLQVSSGDESVQALALDNAVNVQKALGIDQVDIEVVAWGPGLSLLTQNNPLAQRVANLLQFDIRFTACGNTIDTQTRATGVAPLLLDSVAVVPAGVVHIMQLQKQGYVYIKP